ncbi:MAG: hypothetical protein V3T22_05365, partial [Planctomycetota bacterium]
MHWRTPLALLALGLLLTALPAAAAQRGKRKSKPPQALNYHDGELAAARAEALGRNVPVLVLCILEGEEANERFQHQLLDNPPLVAAALHALVVLV